MAINQRLVSAQVNTTDTASSAIPTGQVAVVRSIIYHQATGAVAKTLNFAVNATSVTAANVRRSIAVPAGQSSAEIYPNLVLAAGETLNFSASAGANEAAITVNISRDLAS
jgi:hypothetical protein